MPQTGPGVGQGGGTGHLPHSLNCSGTDGTGAAQAPPHWAPPACGLRSTSQTAAADTVGAPPRPASVSLLGNGTVTTPAATPGPPHRPQEPWPRKWLSGGAEGGPARPEVQSCGPASLCPLDSGGGRHPCRAAGPGALHPNSERAVTTRLPLPLAQSPPGGSARVLGEHGWASAWVGRWYLLDEVDTPSTCCVLGPCGCCKARGGGPSAPCAPGHPSPQPDPRAAGTP